MSFQNTRFVDKKMHAINNIPCRSFVRSIKTLLSLWFTFPWMNVINIYKLDFVVRQGCLISSLTEIKFVAFRSLRTFDSSSAILKN